MNNKNSTVQKNLDLLNEFMKYAFDHPEIFDRIPQEAQLIILPTNDPKLRAENKRMADSLAKKGEKVVIVEIKKPKTIVSKIKLLTA